MYNVLYSNNKRHTNLNSCVWLSRPTAMVHSLLGIGTDDEDRVTLLSRHAFHMYPQVLMSVMQIK